MNSSQAVLQNINVVLFLCLKLLQHRLSLLGNAAGVFLDNGFYLMVFESDFRCQFDPVFTEEVGHVGHSQISKSTVVIRRLSNPLGELHASDHFMLSIKDGQLIGDDVFREYDIQGANRLLTWLTLGNLWFAHEQGTADDIGVLILNTYGEWQSVLTESLERELQLITRFCHGDQIASQLNVLNFVLENFYIAALGHLCEMFLLLECFILAIISHAKYA